jgi:AraC-like DNA-binding protein
MTASDTNQTGGASSTMLAPLLAMHLEAARAFGLDADDLAKRAGIREGDVRDHDGRVPFEQFVRLWELINDTPGAEGIGFWLGKAIDVRGLGVVGYAMQHAPDVRTAFGCLERFRKLVNDVVSPKIEETADQVIFRRTEPPRIARLAALAVAAPVGTITLLRQLTNTRDTKSLAIEAAFQHAPPPNADEYERVLGCPVHFNAAEIRLVLPRAVFDLPLARPDAALFEYLERHAAKLQERLQEHPTTSARVRELAVAAVRAGEPEQVELARQLGMSERTLQRRLKDEGTTFAALVDEVRTDLAKMYLADEKLAIYEVAFLLGYSEPSAFNRAFKRWLGKTPSEYRSAAG